MNNLIFSQVEVGSRLAVLEFDITTTVVIAGALANRDYSQLHHDRGYAQEEAGHKDIFVNTQHQAAFFERYLYDWSGSLGRMGRMNFAMKNVVYAGERISIEGHVCETDIDAQGCAWAKLKLTLSVGSSVSTECEVKYALAIDENDNPWLRQGKDWKP
jgi:acyl dehydratase|tara:strand:- start:22869 stop:23342 length:474 start_codon:yes stop_codon:yes gene_type:complete